MSLPVSIRHQGQTAVIPCHFPQNGEDKKKNLRWREKQMISQTTSKREVKLTQKMNQYCDVKFSIL